MAQANNEQNTQVGHGFLKKLSGGSYELQVQPSHFEKLILDFSGEWTDEAGYQAAVAVRQSLLDIENMVDSALGFYIAATAMSRKKLPHLFMDAVKNVEGTDVKETILFSRITAIEDNGRTTFFLADEHYRNPDEFVQDVEELIAQD